MPVTETKIWLNSSLESESPYVSHNDIAFFISIIYCEKMYTETYIIFETTEKKLILN